MHQHAPIIRAMPVRRARRTRNNIADTNPLWHAALVAHPAAAGLDLDDLAVLMVVPVGAGAGEEGHMVAHDAVLGAGHFVHVDVAGEAVACFGGAGAGAGLG